ncbi:MAG: hypothetical protein WED10_04490, partial [Brumimicrobium sp.]
FGIMSTWKLSLYLFITVLLFACKNQQTSSEYDFLLTCYEDFYLNYNIEITDLMNKFEQNLISENHLKDKSGSSYQELLIYLKENNYFKSPLNKDDFKEVILYKNPKDITNCATSVFGLDSAVIAQTPYFKTSRKITKALSSNEEVSMNYLFKVYANDLSPDELEKPFVKQSILVMLYRWYYKSKFDRDTKIDDSQQKAID